MTATSDSDDSDDDQEPAADHDAISRRVSFFASSNVVDAQTYADWIEIEEADEAVCAAVWEIFAKESTQRGFDARSRRSKIASASLARRHAAGGEMPGGKWTAKQPKTKARAKMGRNENELTERQAKVLAVYRDAAASGESLTNLDVADRAGIVGKNDASRGASASAAKSELREMGLLPKPGDVGTAKVPYARKVAAPAAKAEVVGKAKSGRAGGLTSAKARAEAVDSLESDPIIAALVAHRDAAMARVAKLDAAIAAVRAAS